MQGLGPFRFLSKHLGEAVQALLKAVAQIEIIFTFASTVFIFKEKINRLEVAGCIAIVVGILVLLLT